MRRGGEEARDHAEGEGRERRDAAEEAVKEEGEISEGEGEGGAGEAGGWRRGGNEWCREQLAAKGAALDGLHRLRRETRMSTEEVRGRQERRETHCTCGRSS